MWSHVVTKMSKLLSPLFRYNYYSIRNISVNEYRRKKGLGPRRTSGPMIDKPEFSFTDGRGLAPLSFGAKRRYLRDKYFAELIVKYMKQFELAKSLSSSKQNEHSKWPKCFSLKKITYKCKIVN